MRTSKWYSDDSLGSRQDRVWDDYIKMMYWSQDHAVSTYQNETASQSTLEWWRTWLWKLNFRIRLRMHLKDNINSSICCHTYRGHIRRLGLKAYQFSYVATHIKDTLESKC